MIRNAPPKHPNSDKWYWLDWNETELQGAVVNTATWTVPGGLTKTGEAVSGRRTGIKVAGGVLDEDYEADLEIQTSGGETLNTTLLIRCRKSGH